ncbi:kinase-like domain-containing protein [Neurospora tetraspora]|uniref:Kinase-like domain-containing protein n=1 Tax=Neurospora tetraspora TaxID=94610 RepID=A0AAE0JCC1_9PEZI|nr:kinase-like domain-containing protein [Neurospora tetraspora]
MVTGLVPLLSLTPFWPPVAVSTVCTKSAAVTTAEGSSAPAAWSADLVVTVGEHGDLWLPTDMITELFSVVINPETYLPLIRVGQSLPTYSAFVAHHETRGRLPGFQGPDPPIFQGEWINSGQSVALMPGRDYRLTVKTRHRGVKVGYTFDVVWEDEPIWKILEKLKSTFLKHRQDLLPGPTFDLPGYLRVSNVYWGGSEHRRIGKEAMVTSGTTIGADSCKKVAIKRFTESNPWANRKAAQNEIKRLQLMQHPHIVEYLGHDLNSFTNDVYLGWMGGRDIEGLKFDITRPLVPKDLWSSLLLQMTLALGYLAARNIVHEDVKPGNILYKRFRNGHVNFRLADFSNSGRSWVGQEGFFRPLFRAPEWTDFVDEKEGGTQPSADVWALAMTMICVTKRPHATVMPHVWDKVDQGFFSEAVEAAFQQATGEVSSFENQKLGLLRPMLRLNPHDRAKPRDMSVCIQKLMGITAQRRAAAVAAAAVASNLRRDLEMGNPEVDDSALVVESPQVDDSALEMKDPQVDVSVVEMESPQHDGLGPQHHGLGW